ncbi:MAG: cupredoxin domain-containing protein [Candidatus Nitrosocosmicus sp.]
MQEVKDNQSYDPNPIYIKIGDTVTWINADVMANTVTSGKDYDLITSGKKFNSKSVVINGVYRLKFPIPLEYLIIFVYFNLI